MVTRILVPLDGSAPAEAVANPAFERSFSEPSVASRLVDGLEAETQTYSNAITDGVHWEGIHRFSLIGENPTAEALLAVADAMKVNTFVCLQPFQQITLGDGSIVNQFLRHLCPSPVLLILPRQ